LVWPLLLLVQLCPHMFSCIWPFGCLMLSFIHNESFDVVCADHIEYVVCSLSFPKCSYFLSFSLFFMVCSLLPWNSLPPVCSRGSSSFCLLKQVHISVLEQFFSTLPYLIFTHTNAKFILPWFLGTCHSTLSVVTYQDRLAYWQTFAICKKDLLLELFHTHGCRIWLNIGFLVFAFAATYIITSSQDLWFC